MSRRLGNKIAFTLIPAAVVFALLNWAAYRSLQSMESLGIVLHEDFVQSPVQGLPLVYKPNLLREKVGDSGIALATNEFGYRTAPFAPKSETPRVMILGDSIAFGVFQDQDRTLGALVQSQLKKRGINAEVYNLAIPTYNIIDDRKTYDAWAEKLTPDVVVLQTHVGDFTPIGPVRMVKWKRALPLLSWLYLRFKIATAPEPEAGAQAFFAIAENCRKSHQTLIVVEFPMLDKVPTREPSYEKQVVEKAGVERIDAGRVLQSRDKNLSVFRVRENDRIHPNDYGLEIIAENIAIRIEGFLDNRISRKFFRN